MDSNIISSTNSSANESPGFILKSLMDRWKISEAELCRQTGLPQTTINRLLVGHTTDPRANTLRPIANFFGVTIGQLLGDEPLMHQVEGAKAFELEKVKVPVLDWGSIIPWVLEGMPLTFQNYDRWVFSERDLDEKAFAFIAPSIMERQFGKNSLIIADAEPKYRDGDYVIVLIGETPCIRRVIKDGTQTLLKPLDPILPTDVMGPSLKILGVVVESRVSHFVI